MESHPRRVVFLACVAVLSVAASAPVPPHPATPPSKKGRVVETVHGDTLTALDTTKVQHTVRLEGIDARGITGHRGASNSLGAHTSANSINNSAAVTFQLVFPDSNHLPPHTSELSVIRRVASAISRDLILPEIGELNLPSRELPPVPEIAIDKHGDSLTCEYDIGCSGEAS